MKGLWHFPSITLGISDGSGLSLDLQGSARLSSQPRDRTGHWQVGLATTCDSVTWFLLPSARSPKTATFKDYSSAVALRSFRKQTMIIGLALFSSSVLTVCTAI